MVLLTVSPLTTLLWPQQLSLDISGSVFCGASQGSRWHKDKQSSFNLKHIEVVGFFFFASLALFGVLVAHLQRTGLDDTAQPCNFGFMTASTLCHPLFFQTRSAVHCVMFLWLELVDVHPHKPLQNHTNSVNSCFYSCSGDLFLCFDWQVYDGENTSSRLLGNFTRDGMMGHVINSTSNRLWLEFNSNASGTNQGFRLTYTSELLSADFFFLLYLLTHAHAMVCSSMATGRKHPSPSLSHTHFLHTNMQKLFPKFWVAHHEGPCEEMFLIEN